MTRPTTVGAVLDTAARRLSKAGVASARLDARLLLAHALGQETTALLAWPDRTMTAAERTAMTGLVERRGRREPMSHILGEREFWSLPFRVSPHTLTPRPETETLIEAALDRIGDRGRRLSVLDLGTGSGCLFLALLSEWPRAWGLGVDLSAEALAVARINARNLGLADRTCFLRGDWAAALAGRFEVVVVNPPYIRDDDIPLLEPEVACHEPRLALSGGPDGLDAFRAIAPTLPKLLTSDGAAFLEVGAGQADAVIEVLAESGLRVSGVCSDLAGISRCLVAERENAEIDKKKVGKLVNPD